jgi:serine protease Do
VDDYEFSDSSYFRRYALSLKKSQTVTVDLESDEFDAFLLIERGRERLLQNDDGGGGCQARIVYTATDERPLSLIANSAGPRATGAFTLKVRAGPSPTEPKSTCRIRGRAARARPAGAP